MKVIAIFFVLILQIGIAKIKAQYHVQRNRNPSGCTVPCNLDVDGDGISGCFDKCLNTPPGAIVDSHGCPLDTAILETTEHKFKNKSFKIKINGAPI